ncbi:MAG: glycosyltransferase [Halofilum sp. (in: g-proteobacteria)]|nr:glycosyltransferase [Halofilum sp. (in: g-proteobacteria)]
MRTGPHVGGVARAVETLANECRAAGHEVQVIAPGFPGDEHEPGGDVLRVPAIQNFNGSDFSVRVPIPHVISARIDEFAPDVIHAHHPFLLGNAALRIAYERNLPLVFTHHTLYENYTHYVPFDSPTHAALRDPPGDRVRQLLRRRDRAVEERRRSAARARRRSARSRSIPTGVDTAAFAHADGAGFRHERGLPADARVIGHVGRLAREKNLHFLGEAVTRAPAAPMRRGCGSCWSATGPRPRRCAERFAAAGVARARAGHRQADGGHAA